MEVSDYFAPAITVIELAQETSICIVSKQYSSGVTEDLYEDDTKTILD